MVSAQTDALEGVLLLTSTGQLPTPFVHPTGKPELSGNSRRRDASLERGAKLNGGASPVAPSSGERKCATAKSPGRTPSANTSKYCNRIAPITAAAVRDWGRRVGPMAT